jgi:hypothetical protein
MKSLTISQASKLIADAVANGSATLEEAVDMQAAIRGKYYGKTMTNEQRYRMMVNRFGWFEI